MPLEAADLFVFINENARVMLQHSHLIQKEKLKLLKFRCFLEFNRCNLLFVRFEMAKIQGAKINLRARSQDLTAAKSKDAKDER